MKKSMFYIAFATLAILLVTHTNATIRRVGYFGTFVNGTDYGDLQSAVNTSGSKDTIYIYPGDWSAYINHKVTLIGYGYFISGSNSNTGLQNIIGPLRITIGLYSGSDSTVLQGLDVLTLNSTNNNINNITINRCNVYIYHQGAVQNKWQITQSYIETFTHQCCTSGAIFSNLQISNCIIDNFDFNVTTTAASTGVFINNVIGPSNFQNCNFTLKNNIFTSTHLFDTYCKYEYNVATTAYPLTNTDGNDTANKNVADISTVFVGYPTIDNHSYDERFNLKSGSIAFTAGEGGTQTGIYGGSDPYHLSGIPPIPAFYKLTAPSTTASSNPYTITFSVRSNN